MRDVRVRTSLGRWKTAHDFRATIDRNAGSISAGVLCTAAAATNLRRGVTGLSALVQTVLDEDLFSGDIVVFRGRRGDLLKLLRRDGGVEPP